MNTPVPHITKLTQAHLNQAYDELHEESQLTLNLCNKAIEIALAEQHQAEAEKDLANAEAELNDYITAEEARKLGAGKAEYRYRGSYTSWRWQNWITCQNSYESSNSTWEVQYRAIKQPQSSVAEEAAKPQAGVVGNSAIKQPEPVETVGVYCGNIKIFDMPVEPHAELKAMYEQQVKDGTLKDYYWQFKDSGGISWLPILTDLGKFHVCNKYQCIPKETCQIENLDTGVLKTMTREAAKKLQAELGDTVEWKHPNMWIPPNPESAFACEGIYTYKRKANLVKLDGELMTREAAIAKWESKKDMCDVYCWTDSSPSWDKNLNACYGDFIGINEVAGIEYQLRLKPTVKLTIDDEPAKMFTPTQCEAERLARVDTHDVEVQCVNFTWRSAEHQLALFHISDEAKFEYRLIRKQPKLIPLDWKNVPVGVMTNRGAFLLSNSGYSQVLTNDSPFCVADVENTELELAPAWLQPWIAIQDDEPPAADVAIQLGKLGLDVITSGERYRITGLADGYTYGGEV